MNTIQRYKIALLCLPLVTVLFGLLLWPMLLVVRESVVTADGADITFERFRSLFVVPRYRAALFWSVSLSGAVALVSTTVCLAPAWLLVRREFRGKRWLRAALALPMSFSGVIVGFLVVLLIGRAGFVPELMARLTGYALWSGAAYQFSGLLLGYIYFEIPRATLTLESALRRFDRRLEDAAESLGAKPWQQFAWVTLPALWPPLLSTLTVTFTASLGSFGVLLILSTRQINLLPLEIFTQYLGIGSDRALAAAMSVCLIAAAFLANFAVRQFLDVQQRHHASA